MAITNMFLINKPNYNGANIYEGFAKISDSEISFGNKYYNIYTGTTSLEGESMNGVLFKNKNYLYSIVSKRENYSSSSTFKIYYGLPKSSTYEYFEYTYSTQYILDKDKSFFIVDRDDNRLIVFLYTGNQNINSYITLTFSINNGLSLLNNSGNKTYTNIYRPNGVVLFSKNNRLVSNGYNGGNYGIYVYENLYDGYNVNIDNEPTLISNTYQNQYALAIEKEYNYYYIYENNINVLNKISNEWRINTYGYTFYPSNYYDEYDNTILITQSKGANGDYNDRYPTDGTNLISFDIIEEQETGYNWKFYNNDGTILRKEFVNRYDTLDSINISYSEEIKDNVNIELITSITTETFTYNINLDEYQYLIGYSSYPNAVVPTIKINELTSLTLEGDIDLYEVYETRIPITNKNYKICDNSGLITRWETTSQSNITGLKFEPNGFSEGSVWWYLTPVAYGSQYLGGSLTNNIIGYSRTPNATQAEYLINTSYDVDIQEDTTFYEVYNIPYTPPTTNNQYRILNSEGIVTLLETDNNLLPLIAIRFVYDKIKGVITFSYVQSNGEQTNTDYRPVLEEGIELIGYSLSPYATTPTYTFDEFIEVNIGTSTNFYEVYNVPPDVVYTVYSSDGQSLKGRRTTNNQPVYEFRNYYNEFDGIATVQLVQNDLLMTIQYRPTIPQGYALTGYAITPNAQVPLYPVNSNIQVNFTSDTAFYEVYELISTDDLRLDLYQSSTEPNRVDKSEFLRKVGILTGTLREDCSIVNPVITMEIEGVPNFNYIYIPNFQRYYFVDEIVSISKNIWEVSMSCDVLMTYRGGIYQLTGFIDRNEFTFDDRIVDNKRVVPQGYSILDIPIENELFTGEVSYVLTGTGLYVQ